MSDTKDKRLDNEGLWSDAKTAITISSGDRMDPLHPLTGDIHITDIAHALSRTCRYNGHVGHFYSVARHSLFVADRIRSLYEDEGCIDFNMVCGPERADAVMQGLLHDAAEAYIGDLVRPLKHGPSLGVAYLQVEKELERVIADVFSLEYPWPEYVSEADNYVLLQRELGGENLRWTWDSTPDQDEAEFIERFRTLTHERRSQ